MKTRKKYFEQYSDMANNQNLTTTEIVGRHNSQKESEKMIFNDMLEKIENLNNKNINVLDIGCGCGVLVHSFIDHCCDNENNLVLIDSENMLNKISNEQCITKIAGEFPHNLDKINQKFDVITVYSVVHYIFIDGNIFDFIDSCVELLNYGGELLIADIPNLSKKQRFLSTQFGIDMHNKTSDNKISNTTEQKYIKMALDDSFILSLLARYRNMGFETYLLPQKQGLPFNYTREDLLIKKNYE